MAIYRFALIVGLLFLVRSSCSAPTLSAANRTEALFRSENIATSQNGNEPSTAPPSMAMGGTARDATTPQSSTEEKMVGQNKTDGTKTVQSTTEGNLGSVTVGSSSNVTNETVVEEDGPSSILYPVCSSYLGIHNKKIIKDDQMSASSTLDISDLMKLINATLVALESNSTENSTQVKSNYTITGNMTAAHDGRLGNTEGSWCASGDSSDGEHHLIVDLGQVYILEGVVTQGRSDSDNWVTEYTVSHSSDNRHWVQVEKDGQVLVFKGNKDRHSVAVGSFPHRIAARYIKFTPKAFHGKLMCMRVEAVGCYPDAVNVAKNQPTEQSSSERNFTSHKVVDGKFISNFPNETCTRTKTESSPWLRIDLRRTYHVKEIFLSNQDNEHGFDMWDFEVRVGRSLDNEGNNNALCRSLYDLLPGHIGTVVCKNGTVGRYVNIKVPRGDSQVNLCEVAVIGVAETVVKLGLEDIASSLQTGSVVDSVSGKAGDVVGGLLGQLQGQLQGGILRGQGIGWLNNLKGQGMGMLNNLKGQGMGMLNNLKGQGMGMLNNLKGQGLEMANKLKDKGLEMANKMKEQGMEMANKAKEQALEAANKAKEKAMEMADKAKEQAMEAANKAKEKVMEEANKAKEQGMAMAGDLQNQGMGMVGDMQGQVNQQQDKFKKKLKEILDKGKEYLEVGKEEMEKFKKKGYIETGKEYMDIGLGMTMDGIAFIQAKLMESLSNIAGNMTKQITTLSEYDTSDIKGLLDDVDPVPVRNFVEEAKPKIAEYIDEMQRLAKKYMEIGIEKAEEAKEEIESEADSAKNDATNLGQNVAGKATAAGKNVANKAQDVGMKVADKAKAAGMDAVNKAKKTGMDAMNKAKETAMGAVNKAKEKAMGAVNKAKSMGMGALNEAKSLGTGALGDLKSAGMGALNQAKGLGMGAFGQLKQTGVGALGQLKGVGQGMLGQLSSAGRDLLKKAKNMKPSQLKEMQQIQMLQKLKQMKKMQELQKKLESEQDVQWREFEKLSKEMEDEIKSKGEAHLDGNDVPAPNVGGGK